MECSKQPLCLMKLLAQTPMQAYQPRPHVHVYSELYAFSQVQLGHGQTLHLAAAQTL